MNNTNYKYISAEKIRWLGPDEKKHILTLCNGFYGGLGTKCQLFGGRLWRLSLWRIQTIQQARVLGFSIMSGGRATEETPKMSGETQTVSNKKYLMVERLQWR